MQPGLAVNQRPGSGGTDLPIGQPQLGQQRGHFRTAHHKRFGADIHRRTADLLGAQHPAQPVGRIEERDARLGADRRPQSVCRGQA